MPDNSINSAWPTGSQEKASSGAPKVGSVVSALAILRLLSNGDQMGVNAIARGLAISPSSCFNLLKTLTTEEFLDFDEASKTYSLGPGCTKLARRSLDARNHFGMMRSRMKIISRRYSVTTCLWQRTRDDKLILQGFTEGEHENRIHPTVGSQIPILTGATGRAVAALRELDAASLEIACRTMKWDNPPKVAAYRRQVEQARRQNWSLDEGHYVRGIASMAVLVADENKEMHFSLSNVMFAGQYDLAALKKMAADTQDLAAYARYRLFGIR